MIYVLTMEFFHRRGLQPRQREAVLISALSGLVAGILVSLSVAIVSRSFSHLALGFLISSTLGCATGAVTALVLMLFSTKKTAEPARP